MINDIHIVNTENITDITSEVMMDNGNIKLMPANFWRKFAWDDFRIFCHYAARYGIHTIEQQEFLKNIISGRSVIEIGAGHGDIGFHLGIKMTDSKIQNTAYVKNVMSLMQQPIMKYSKSVEKIEALEVVKKYKPQVVIGSWITTFSPRAKSYNSSPFGVKEKKILDLIETYILIGNVDIHKGKPIFNKPHDEYYFDWIISRGKNQLNNRIWVWNNKRKCK